MPDGVFLGFDFGYKRIGMAIGQQITKSASPLATLHATQGIPEWSLIAKTIKQWSPQAIIIGFPTKIDGSEQYTSIAVKEFAQQLHTRFKLPIYLVDERLTTIEARAHLFASGGYDKLKKTAIDSIAACVILEQWLQEKSHTPYIET